MQKANLLILYSLQHISWASQFSGVLSSISCIRVFGAFNFPKPKLSRQGQTNAKIINVDKVTSLSCSRSKINSFIFFRCFDIHNQVLPQKGLFGYCRLYQFMYIVYIHMYLSVLKKGSHAKAYWTKKFATKSQSLGKSHIKNGFFGNTFSLKKKFNLLCFY